MFDILSLSDLFILPVIRTKNFCILGQMTEKIQAYIHLRLNLPGRFQIFYVFFFDEPTVWKTAR